MNIRLIFTFISFLTITSIFSQKKGKKEVLTPFEISYKKYRNTLKYADLNTAINAVNEILIIAPDKTNFKDTLLALYFNSGNKRSTVILAKEMEAEGNTNVSTLEVLAVTFHNAGALKKALPYYEKLYDRVPSLYYLYQIAMIQFNLMRLQESSVSLAKILDNQESLKQKVTIDYKEKTSQKIEYAAAAYNILGVISSQMKEIDQATEYFKAALKISPEFLLAKNNLQAMKK